MLRRSWKQNEESRNSRAIQNTTEEEKQSKRRFCLTGTVRMGKITDRKQKGFESV